MERITELIQHPEHLDRDTLYELRSLCALYPYYQPVRLLMLQNLYLLHDATFDEELRRAAIYITDRRVLFNMIEASHYQLKRKPGYKSTSVAAPETTGRTMSLIDNFLDSIPKDEEEPAAVKRKPTPADAAIDYVAYLLETADENEVADEVPEMPGQQLIDSFYSKALEIIQRLSLQFPKKNAYFADQIRFLEKLIINNNKKNK